MTVTATPIYPQSIITDVAQINNASGTSLVTLSTPGTNGSRIDCIIVTSTDTSNRDLALWLTVSSVNYLLGTVQIPLTAGSVDNVVSVDILRSAQIPGFAYDNNGNKYLNLANGAVLSIAALTTVTSGKLIQAFAQRANF